MAQKRAGCTVPILPEAFSERNDTALYWLGGGGFMLNASGTVILIDPVLTMKPDGSHSENGLRMFDKVPIDAHDVPKCDAVLYTHRDDDHLGTVTAPVLVQLGPLFAGTADVKEAFDALVTEKYRFTVCRAGDRFELRNIRITVIPADHPWQLMAPERFPKIYGREDCCGFMIETNDGRYLFTGDTRLMREHIGLCGIDVLTLDVSNDKYHLGPDDAATLAEHFPDAVLIPYHYGTYDAPDEPAHNGDPENVARRSESLRGRMRILSPGEMYVYSDMK